MPTGGPVFLLLAELLVAELLINLFLFFPDVSYTQREGASSYWQKLCHLVWLIRESLAVETSESWHQTDKTATISEGGDENADVASLHLQTVEN